MDDETTHFLEKKEEVLKNLDILHFNLEKCIDSGLTDTDSMIYNHIEDLVDEVDSIDSLEELEEFVFRAKTIESQINNWLVTFGESTISLSWPTFK